ncbi:Arc family DNA-binding protein [Xanthomonas sacchari]|uniref:Arc family DNA-binding protein n=1 Tax=Xanthomonas sacchari TaxID=56458 RepID=UPI00225E2D08|nr:Arc family DNA-binding protein [Xanthomonas sacchari]UYK81413.1 Arc family DNA-binding protein [Xanthomonas sacchari]
MKPESQRTGNFSVRMPVALREMLERSAQESGRSVNAEIVHRLLSGSAPPSPDQLKRQVVVEALMEEVAEVCRWAEHVEHAPDDQDAQRWLKEALDDLSMWHTRLQRLDSEK